MSRKYFNNKEYEYNEFDYEDSIGRVRNSGYETKEQRKRKWEKEHEFDQDHDYDERK